MFVLSSSGKLGPVRCLEMTWNVQGHTFVGKQGLQDLWKEVAGCSIYCQMKLKLHGVVIIRESEMGQIQIQYMHAANQDLYAIELFRIESTILTKLLFICLQ